MPTPTTDRPEPPILHFRIGGVTITQVIERITGVPSDAIVPGITTELIAAAPWAAPYFAEDGRLLLSNHTFVVQSGDTTIVVDTCVGTALERPLPGDAGFLDRLAAAIDGGLAAVDIVLCTHLHFDHVGWNTILIDGRWEPTFPNAQYLVTRPELDHVLVDDHMGVLEPSIQPLLDAGLLDAVPTDHRVTDEVALLSTPGHTPGHVSVLIESAGERATITGDATHTPLQFAHPELAATRFDHDSEQSTATRRALIAEHLDTDRLVLGTHFAPPTAGHLRTVEGAVQFVSAPQER